MESPRITSDLDADLSVLFIHHGTLHGGAPLSLLYTAEGLKKRGYKVSIGLVKTDRDLKEFYEKKGFRTYQLNFIHCYYYWSAAPQYWTKGHTYRNLLRAAWNWRKSKVKLIDFLQENHFDLVHLNSVGLINSASALLEINQPFVWHIREYGPSNSDWRHEYFKKVLKRAKNLIFLSKAEQISWLGNTDVGNVVHNFIDIDFFSKSNNEYGIRKKYGVHPNTSILLFLGGFKKHKGIDIVLDAASQLLKGGADFRLVMPGTLEDAPNKYTLKIEELGIEKNCILDHFITDIRPYFIDADVLLFPATVPHFARPVIEAAAMEVPSIATRLPPMDELIIEGETGDLYEQENLDELVHKTRRLILDRNLRREMGKAGRVFAEKHFNADRQIDKIISVYSQTLSGDAKKIK